MIRSLSLILLLSVMIANAVPAVSGGRPDQDTLKKVRQLFPEWTQNSSGRCAVSRNNGLWAWKIVLECEINPRVKSTMSRDGKGYLIIVMVPDAGIDPGSGFIQMLDWSMPESDLKQYTEFLGRGGGYYWYMKSDIARLEFLQRRMQLSGGVNMAELMAEALNVSDYALYTSQIAMAYFRDRGPGAVPLIMKSMRIWEEEEKKPPVRHMIALKQTNSTAGAEELMKMAESPNHEIAHHALRLLVEAPYPGPDSFYLRALSVPEYTGKIIKIFRTRKKTDLILPRLRKLVKAPRSLKQYTEVLAALREFERPGKAVEIPEFTACNDIMILMMRMGETSGDPVKYVGIDAEGMGTPAKLAEEERKRIAPHLEILRKSSDHEAVFAGAIALAAFAPEGRVFAKEYTSRVRRVGVEIIRMLPSEFVFSHFDMLAKSLKSPREQSLLKMIRQEYGGR